MIVKESSKRQNKYCQRERGRHQHDCHPELLEEGGEHGEEPGDVQSDQDQHYAVPGLSQSSKKDKGIKVWLFYNVLLCPTEDLR